MLFSCAFHPFNHLCLCGLVDIYLFFGFIFSLLCCSRCPSLGPWEPWQAGFRCFCSLLCPWVFVNTFLLSNTAVCSRLKLYFLFHCSRICHFYRIPCAPLLDLEEETWVFRAVKMLFMVVQCWMCHYKCVLKRRLGCTMGCQGSWRVREVHL